MKVSSAGLPDTVLFMSESLNYETSFDSISLNCLTGELKEIKQDISSLRYALLERGNHDMETLAKLIRQLGKVMHNQQKKEQKN